jgi:hypothetical protein
MDPQIRRLDDADTPAVAGHAAAAIPERPARKVANGRKQRSIAHRLPVAWLGRSVPYESRLEADLVMVMAADADVTGIWSQPETFRWRAEGRLRRYTPDFLITTYYGPVYREVKPIDVLVRDPTLGGRLEAIRGQCACRGARFEIWTEIDIRAEPRFANARAVHFAPHPGRDRAVAASLREAVSDLVGSAPASLLLSRAGLASGNLGDLLALVAVGDAVIVDMERGIGPDTLIGRGRR